MPNRIANGGTPVYYSGSGSARQRWEVSAFTYLEGVRLVEMVVQSSISSIPERSNNEGNGMDNAQAQADAAKPAMKHVQFLIANASKHGDQVEFAGQGNKPRGQSDSHEASTYSHWRRAVASMLPVVRPDSEGQEEAIKREQDDEYCNAGVGHAQSI